MRFLLLGTYFFFAGVFVANAADGFDLPPPKTTKNLQAEHLWATEYHVHYALASSAPDALALRDDKGQSLGEVLGHHDWCNAAMEGTVLVKDGDATRTFNAGSLGPVDQTDCSDIFKHLSPKVQADIKRQSFFEIGQKDKFGLGGTDKYRLVPFRSIAVDRSVVPWGTALFIPGLAGAPIRLPDGRKLKHDGYVYAVDKGGQITGTHIDVFVGLPRNHGDPPVAPKIITSDPTHPFEAFVVEDAYVVAALRSLHVRYGN